MVLIKVTDFGGDKINTPTVVFGEWIDCSSLGHWGDHFIFSSTSTSPSSFPWSVSPSSPLCHGVETWKRTTASFVWRDDINLILSIVFAVNCLKNHSEPWLGGSVGWTIIGRPKVSGFDSQPGDIPRLWVQSPVGAHTGCN